MVESRWCEWLHKIRIASIVYWGQIKRTIKTSKPNSPLPAVASAMDNYRTNGNLAVRAPDSKMGSAARPMSAGQSLQPYLPSAMNRCLPPPPGIPRDSVVLLQAIDEMDPKTLRDALKKICITVPRAMELSVKDLLVYRDACDLEYGELVNNDDAAREAITRQTMANRGEPISKLKTSKYTTCKNCKKIFDRCQNGIGDCVWHSGEIELDEEDICSPLTNDCDKCLIDEHKEEIPEAFRWTCCEEQADAKGCMRTKHESSSLPPREELNSSSAFLNDSKRQRIW